MNVKIYAVITAVIITGVFTVYAMPTAIAENDDPYAKCGGEELADYFPNEGTWRDPKLPTCDDIEYRMEEVCKVYTDQGNLGVSWVGVYACLNVSYQEWIDGLDAHIAQLEEGADNKDNRIEKLQEKRKHFKNLAEKRLDKIKNIKADIQDLIDTLENDPSQPTAHTIQKLKNLLE